MISTDVRLSRLPVGSSASKIDGRLTSPRAMATRCCCPPESCDGKCISRSPKPTSCSACSARFLPSSLLMCAYSVGNSTFSSAVVRDSRLNPWKTKPILRLRIVASSFLVRLEASIRSEEHTSELQSRLHLVCRLLLEKKKQ